MEAEQQEQRIRAMVITREDILKQHAPWIKNIDNDDDEYNDESPSSQSQRKAAILQCYSENTGFDGFEFDELVNVFSKNENKNFERDPILCRTAFSLDNLQFTCSPAEVVHMIGHNVGGDEGIDGSNYTVVRKGESSEEKYILLNDNDMSFYLSRIKPLKLLYLNMCNKFELSCMVMARMDPDEIVYVICAHGKIHDRGARFMSEIFYQELSQKDFNIIDAFDNMQRRASNEDTENQWGRNEWFPCLMRKAKGEKPILLRANWKYNENDIDDEVKERFEVLCNKNLDSEVGGSKEHILEGGYRSWRDGDKIGIQERAALRAVGFITDRHTYTLDKDGMVVNIDSFWRVQINFDQGLWPKAGGKRKWTDLWEIALSNILKKCEDIDALTACESHLRKSIRLREMKVEEYSRDQGQGDVQRKMTKAERNHISMLYYVGNALTLTTRRLYYTHSDNALKAVGLGKKNCTMSEVWSTQLPNKIQNFNNKCKLTECQTHLKMALEWRKKEYEQKEKQERDESHLKELQSMISIVEDTTLTAVGQRLLTLNNE